jgi:hypothetical protein
VDKWVLSAKKHSNRLFLLNHWRLTQFRTGEDRPERWYATADTGDLDAATDGVIPSTNGTLVSAGIVEGLSGYAPRQVRT